ncbi:hypothetical protein BJV78DRAFT_1201906 [Lactifluus subvellereus]|nr:hypothetical protein BJV78DRAFT_1201906 [Lactifluus subvellereus]
MPSRPKPSADVTDYCIVIRSAIGGSPKKGSRKLCDAIVICGCKTKFFFCSRGVAIPSLAVAALHSYPHEGSCSRRRETTIKKKKFGQLSAKISLAHADGRAGVVGLPSPQIDPVPFHRAFHVGTPVLRVHTQRPTLLTRPTPPSGDSTEPCMRAGEKWHASKGVRRKG